MSIYSRGFNRVPTPLRQGNAVGGALPHAVTLSITANAWHRMMPHANTGSLVDGDDRKLNVGALRNDVLEVDYWNLVILNEGYHQEHIITEYEGNVVTFHESLLNTAGLRNAGLDEEVEFIMYPYLLNPLGLTYSADADDDVDIGHVVVNEYSPATVQIKKLFTMKPGECFKLSHSRLDKLFIRFPVITAANNELSWGEHYKVAG